ncbi:MAG: hypothetical protein ABI586_00390 [Candidatus Nanopelagicales bacterium]
MRRFLTALFVFVSSLLLVAAPVSAASPPTISPAYPKGDIDLGNLNDGPTGDVCAFPVDVVIHVLGAGSRTITFHGQGVTYNAFLFAAAKMTLTNLDTGESVTVNISGPGFLNSEGLPVVGPGPQVIWEPIDQGGVRFIHGRTSYSPVSYGVHATLLSGTEENLCDRVA